MIRRNSRFLFLLALAACAAVLAMPGGVYAVPASPDVLELQQPDGAIIKAVQWGDENRHGWETEDGYTIVFEEKLQQWVYARQGFDGSLVGTAFIAGKDAPPSDLKKRIRPQNPQGQKLPLKQSTKELSLAAPGASSDTLVPLMVDGPQKIVPPTGTGKVPVLLINFANKTITYSVSNFTSLLFGTDKHSMKDYYEEVSYNAFTVSPGSNGIKGWFKSVNNHAYYGSNSSGYDDYPGTLVREAVVQAEMAGFNFAEYDSDGDCYVDVVAIVHQGPGEEASGNPYDIWSHRWTLESAFFYGNSDGGEYTTNDTCIANNAVMVKVNDYIIMPEKYGAGISTMGVFAHEYGHSLGLPDLYDRDYSSAGVGKWSLMAAGSWNKVTRAGDRPAHLDAWSKYKLGWVAPMMVTTVVYNEPISAVETTADVYQLRSGSPSDVSGEYFLVENRQKTGFDAGLPGPGLLIWHIDQAKADNDDECYPPWQLCNSTYHYKVNLAQADDYFDLEWGYNQGDTGDPYPGLMLNRNFSETSDQYNNSKLYTGAASNVTITNISNSGPVMTATMNATAIAPITVQTAVDNPTDDNGALSWTDAGAANWSGQIFNKYYGSSAAQSGGVENNGYSAVYTEVTVPAGGTLSFFWKVSSEPAYDKLKFSIDGVQKAVISGEVNWKQKSYTLTAGTHTLSWMYAKDYALSKGVDAGWIDKVEVSPYTKIQDISLSPAPPFNTGDTVTIQWNAPAQAEKYKLYYTINNGLSYTLMTPGYVTGTSYSWAVPPMNGNKTGCRVKVVGYNAANVSVGSAVTSPFTINVLTVTYPNSAIDTLTGGAPSNIDYTINQTATAIASASFYYTINGGTSWKLINAVPDTTPGDLSVGPHSYPWTVPQVTESKTKCKVKVVLKNSAGGVVATDMSDAFFTINP